MNGKRAEIGQRLSPGDRLEFRLGDEFFSGTRRGDRRFLLAGDALSVLYEDADLLILDKPAGLLVHPDGSGAADTLVNRVLKRLYLRKEYVPDSENSFVPAVCNRIDRNTSGLVMAAKNAKAERALCEALRNRTVRREYRAVAVGRPQPEHALAKAFLLKDGRTNRVSVFPGPRPGARIILTEYSVLKTDGPLSLLGITLHTGRPHQIRAHMAYLGTPLLGELKYGNPHSLSVSRALRLSRQALSAYRLELHFPDPGSPLHGLDGKSFTSRLGEALVRTFP